jgi:hypothetical protein
VLRQSRREPGQPPAPAERPALPAAATVAAPIALPAGRTAAAGTRDMPRLGGPAREVPSLEGPTREVPAFGGPTREVPAMGEPTREVPALNDGPVLRNPVVAPPAGEPGAPATGSHDAGPAAVAADDSADPGQPGPVQPEPEPEPVTPPDGLPVMRRDATAPATVIAPAEPATVIAPARPAIRYAGSGPLTRPGKPVTAEPDPASGAAAPADAPATSPGDYWDAGAGGHGEVQYAGLVYAAREERADKGPADDDDTTAPVRRRRPAAEPDDDAPPFATAPFAAVPRLNRVRSTPEPPADDEDDDTKDE